MNNKAVFAGSFDPFTLGHYEIAARAVKQFDILYVAVADGNQTKACRFGLKKRLRIAQLSLEGLKNVVVVPFRGFLVDFMKENDVRVFVRGLRNSVDFEYEKNLFNVYRSQDATVEGLYLMASGEFSHISGSLVRDILALGGDAGKYVCKEAAEEIK